MMTREERLELAPKLRSKLLSEVKVEFKRHSNSLQSMLNDPKRAEANDESYNIDALSYRIQYLSNLVALYKFASSDDAFQQTRVLEGDFIIYDEEALYIMMHDDFNIVHNMMFLLHGPGNIQVIPEFDDSMFNGDIVGIIERSVYKKKFEEAKDNA